jgi:quercetin dioxygenase-like cupin family protein
MESVIDKVNWTLESINGESAIEVESLNKLKRGVYAKSDLHKGKILEPSDFFYAMPVQEGQLNASSVDKLVGTVCPFDINKRQPVSQETIDIRLNNEAIVEILKSVKVRLEKSAIALSGLEKAEISCHYGLDSFPEYGAFIIDKINREYCKKLIVMDTNQKHPVHHHIQKEEAFELLSGDCCLVLEGKEIHMKPGKPIVIARGIKHSFSSQAGCVIEEVSTTHIPGDSIYEDPRINSLKLEERKIKVKL